MIAHGTSHRSEITRDQERLYRYVRRHFLLYQAGPDFSELCRAFSRISPFELARSLDTLAEQGYLEWEDGLRRSVRPLLTFLEEKMIDLPVLETEVLSALCKAILERGEAPRIDDLAEQLQLPLEDLLGILRRLVRSGLVAPAGSETLLSEGTILRIQTDRVFTRR